LTCANRFAEDRIDADRKGTFGGIVASLGSWCGLFNDENLVPAPDSVPVMELAEQTGLSDLLDEHVVFRCERVRSGRTRH
jgi:hypothetical protein